jgi:hypothetical protein
VNDGVTADAPDNWDAEVEALCALFETAPPISTR